MLAGRGPGLTPAGDDVLAGIAGWRHADGAPVSLTAPRGSPIGLAYLRCAERGELPEPARRTLDAVRAGDAALAARRARVLGRWGATSGGAMLCGMAAASGARVIDVGPNFIARPYRGVSVQEAAALDAASLRAGSSPRGSTGARSSRGRRRRPSTRSCRSSASRRRRHARPRPRRARAGRPRGRRVRGRSVGRHRQRGQMARAARARPRRAHVRRTGPLRACQLHRRPAPVAVRVVEVVPPEPPKLLEMARAVVDFDEDLPPVELAFEPIDLRELAAAHPAAHYLFPCRCSGLDAGVPVDFLDAGPPQAAAWTLVGCERSRQIHVALYGVSRRAGRFLPAPARGRRGAR